MSANTNNSGTPATQRPTALQFSVVDAIADLAAGGHLVAYIQFDGAKPPHHDWQAGKLYQAIQTGKAEVTPLLAIGTNADDLIAIAIDPKNPRVVTIPKNDALKSITVKKTPLTGPRSLHWATQQPAPHPFIAKRTGSNVTTVKVMPLQPRFLPCFITDNTLHHPAVVHNKVTAPSDVRSTDPTGIWLQCATTKHQTALSSALAIQIKPLQDTLPRRIADTLRNDLEELLAEKATPLLAELELAQALAPRTETITDAAMDDTHAPAPSAQATAAPTIPIATANAPDQPRGQLQSQQVRFRETTTPRKLFEPTNKPPQTSPIDLTDQARPPTAPQGPPHGAWQPHWPPALTGMPYHALPYPNINRPPQQPFGWPQQYPTWSTNPAQHAPAVTPDQPRFPGWQQPTPGVTLPSILTNAEIADKRITALLAKDHLSEEEVEQIKVFNSVRNATQAVADRPTIHADRIYAILGFAGLAPQYTDDFHRATLNVWRDLIKETTKAGRELIVDQRLVNPMTRHCPKLEMSLHQEWIKAVASFDFAPQPLPPGDKPGLGPMAYVHRTRTALHKAKYHHSLLTEASTVSTEDIAKTKLGTPVVPGNADALTNVLSRMLYALEFLFTTNCPLAVQLRIVIRALDQDRGTLAEAGDFQWKVAAEILWQITVATQNFFNNPCSQQDHEIGRYPRPNLSRLAESIIDGTIPVSLNKAPMYCKPHQDRPRQQADRQNGGDRNKRRRNDRDGRQIQPEKRNRAPLTTQLSRECAKIMEDFTKDSPQARLPSMYQVRQVAQVADDTALAQLLGLQPSDCIKYHFYGKCSYPNCRRTHVTKTTTEDHAKLLRKALATSPPAPAQSK